jgi:Ca-activated chloride channel family protein
VKRPPRPAAGLEAAAAALAVALSCAVLAGCDARIGAPRALWALWLLPALAVFYVLSLRARRARLRRFAVPSMIERLTAGAGVRRAVVKACLVTIAVTSLLVALAHLQVGYTWEEVERRGVDIVIALDVSDSMLVEDAGRDLSRLERAKREIHDLLQRMSGDRVAIVAFAGVAFVQCPMTLDYGAAELFLDSLDSEAIPVQGTDLAQALETSLAAFRGGAAGSKAVLLITDGEDHSGRAVEVAKRMAAEGVRIFAIGIGSEEGAPIPARNGGFRRDRSGAIILSRLDEPTLQKIALATDGRYVRSVTGDLDLEQIYVGGIKASLEEREIEAHRRQRWEDRFQWLLGAALAALMIDGLLADAAGARSMRAKSRPAAAAPRAAAAALVAVLIVAGAPRAQGQVSAAQRGTASPQSGASEPGEGPTAAAKPERRFDTPEEAYEAGEYSQALDGFLDLQVERPEDAAVMMNVGSAHYQLDDLESAARSFEGAGAKGDDRLRAQAWYDLGNVAYRQNRFEEAIAAYHQSLDLDPGDTDAKFNLEVAHAALERQQQQQAQQQPQQQQDQQQQQQQEQSGQHDQQRDEQKQDQGQGGSDSRAQEQKEEEQRSQGEQEQREQEQRERQQQQPQSEQQDSPEQQAQAGARESGEGVLSPAEARRLLESLEEGRPRRKVPPGRQRDQEKDW